MELLDYGFQVEPNSVVANPRPSLQLLVVGPLSYRQNWELRHDEGGNRTTEGIHQIWDVSNRPTLLGLGYTKVSGTWTYAIVQEEFSSIRNIQDRFSARVLDSVWIRE